MVKQKSLLHRILFIFFNRIFFGTLHLIIPVLLVCVLTFDILLFLSSSINCFPQIFFLHYRCQVQIAFKRNTCFSSEEHSFQSLHFRSDSSYNVRFIPNTLFELQITTIRMESHTNTPSANDLGACDVGYYSSVQHRLRMSRYLAHYSRIQEARRAFVWMRRVEGCLWTVWTSEDTVRIYHRGIVSARSLDLRIRLAWTKNYRRKTFLQITTQRYLERWGSVACGPNDGGSSQNGFYARFVR